MSKTLPAYGDYGNKIPSGNNGKTSNSSRVKNISRNDTLQWKDIPLEEQAKWTEVGGRLYLTANLSPSAQLKYAATPHGHEGAMACVRQGLKVGSHVRILRDGCTNFMSTSRVGGRESNTET